MATKTRRQAQPDPRAAAAPPGYDPRAFPAFAVTVDVVILTLRDGTLQVLLVRRGEEPFRGCWAIPGGFKRPTETLDEAASRELVEETGVVATGSLRQFGAYGDPGRDPRMNVVTVGYLAVLRHLPAPIAGTDAAAAAVVPVPEVLEGHRALAFDRSVAGDAWVVPTGHRTRPGPSGGRPAELYRAGAAWRTGGPIHRERRSPT
jgi:ADP-ribose pyrophosphatase YjhB (NUDIX family)